MTTVWRKMQGVETHESASEAEYLNIMFYLQTSYDLTMHTNAVQCRYTIDGDTIERKWFESSDEALDWIHEKILDELETNQKALNNDQSSSL